MDNLINLKDLRQNVAKYATQVSKGNSYVVMKRSRPLFKICPVDENGWETVIDFTRFQAGGISVHELLKKLETF